jgi:hypothetical protein
MNDVHAWIAQGSDNSGQHPFVFFDSLNFLQNLVLLHHLMSLHVLAGLLLFFRSWAIR